MSQLCFIPVILEEDYSYTASEYCMFVDSNDIQSIMSETNFIENFVNPETGIGMKNGDALLVVDNDDKYLYVLRDNRFESLNNAEAQIIGMMLNVEEEEDVRL